MNKDDLGCKSVVVNEEYMKAFRTKSYIEIHSKVQGQLRDKEFPSPSSLSFSFSSLPLYIHFSDYLLEPCQETLAKLIQSFNLHRLIVDYFQASLDACKICEILLLRIHRTRANYQIIKRVNKLTKRLQDGEHDGAGDQSRTIFMELAKFSKLANPFMSADSMQFQEIHQSCKSLLPKLVSKSKKTRGKVKLHRLCKRVAGFSLIVSYGAVAAAMVVLAIHSVVGIVIAPGIMAVFCAGAVRNRDRVFARKRFGLSLLENLGAQMDAAAKGIYYLVKDFDTMSRLVSRLHDEVEHIKSIVDICVRNGRRETLMKLVKEFQGLESFFLEQLAELEDQICLCLLNINRSRMHVLQEINKGLNSNSVLTRPID